MKLNIVPARQGLQWVKLGIRVFARQPLAMTGLFFMFMLVISLISFIPFIGSILALAAIPGATLGYMAATHEAIKGKFPMPTLLLLAFRVGRERAAAMLVLGALYAISFVGVMGLSALVDGGQFAKLYLMGEKMEADVFTQPGFIAAMYMTLALYIPVSLAFWHAPALVHWHGIAPVKSLFFSLVACLRNFGAFALYGMAWMLLTLGTGLAVSLIGTLFGSPALAGTLMLPCVLVVACLFFSSLFFTFHDCFISEDRVA